MMKAAPRSTFTLNPETLKTVEQLQLISARLVDGILGGRHRTARLGHGIEFSSYRPYVQGDDLRSIDWKLWGRTDHYYIRQYDLDTHMPAYLFLDTSGSMGFGKAVQKFDYARLLVACLAHLCAEQHDAAGLVLFGETSSLAVPPQSGSFQVPHMCEVLTSTGCSGADGPQESLIESLAAFRRKGLVAVVSDFLWPVGDLDEFLGRSQGYGHDTVLFQVSAREEVDFPYRGNLTFRDLETGDLVDVACAEVKDSYAARWQGHLNDVAGVCGEHNVDLLRMVTDEDLGERLAEYLGNRVLEVRR